MSEAMAQMPQYQSHKKVWALKIAGIEPAAEDGTTGIIPEDKRFARLTVPSTYMKKHHPEVGGYYVVYDDGYKSFSPAKAFEEGYTLIG